MMGDRFGEVIKTRTNKNELGPDIAAVKLDKSGKTIRVILDDCEVI
jgi:hypothetical protein